jgi:hypothetical protein
MKPGFVGLSAAITAAFLVLSPPCSAAEKRADPEETRLALVPLFAASTEFVPLDSGCAGDYGQRRRRAQIGDLLSMQLAYFFHGNNLVTGKCTGAIEKRCSVTIYRSFGEDVSSARIDFLVRDGRTRPELLRGAS